jgi:hypothetical protein
MGTNFYPGDSVVCKVGYGKILEINSKDFEFTHSFDIICFSDQGYILLIPQDMYLVDSFPLALQHCKVFGLDKKFVGGEAHYISDEHILSVRSRMTGLCCMKCHEPYEYAEVNRIDENGNGALLCWVCRAYPYH